MEEAFNNPFSFNVGSACEYQPLRTALVDLQAALHQQKAAIDDLNSANRILHVSMFGLSMVYRSCQIRMRSIEAKLSGVRTKAGF